MIWQSRNYERLAAAIIILLGFMYLLALNPLLGINGDNAKYIILAKSIVSGNGFRIISSPDKPPETTYGFGYPLLIAPAVYFFPDSVIALKLISVFFAVAVLIAIFQLFKRCADLPAAVAIVALSGICHYTMFYVHQVMTELPYLFFSLLTMYLIEKYSDADTYKNKYLLLGSVGLAMAYFIRTVGIFLFVAAVSYLLIRKKIVKAVLIFLCFLVVTGPWFIRNLTISESPSYLAEFMQKNPYDPEQGMITLSCIRERVVWGAKYHRRTISNMLGCYNQKNWLFVMPVMIVGFVVSCRRRIYLHNIYVPLYLIVHLLWYWKTLRFIVPLTPFILYYFINGLCWFFGRNRRAARIATGIAVLFIFLLNFQLDIMIIKKEQKADYYPAEWENYFQIADWVRGNVPESAIVMCRKPYLFYLRSNRRTVGYPFTRDAEKIMSAIMENGVDYVVLDTLVVAIPGGTTRKYLFPAILKNKDMFELLASTENGPKTLLLQVRVDDYFPSLNQSTNLAIPSSIFTFG